VRANLERTCGSLRLVGLSSSSTTCTIKPFNNTSYAVVEFGEGKHPRDFYFLVRFAGFAGKAYEKRMILGGPTAPGTLWVNFPP
jgi:hypothetical protein